MTTIRGKNWHNEMGSPRAARTRRPLQDKLPIAALYRRFPPWFKWLMGVLRFLEAPWEHSLWWIAGVSWLTGFFIIVYAITSVLMMMSIQNAILGAGIIIAFALSGFFLWGWRSLE